MLVSSVSSAFLPTSEKLAFNYETTVTTLLLARLLIGLLLLSLFLFTTGEKFSLPCCLVFPRFISGVFALGIIAALYNSVKFVDGGIAILILSLYPAVLTFFYYFQRKEFLTLIQWIYLCIVLFGLALLLSDQEFKRDLFRLLMSCLALFCTVVFTIISSDRTKLIG
jgi:drug/metabolite transporter (DMT)-like permease